MKNKDIGKRRLKVIKILRRTKFLISKWTDKLKNKETLKDSEKTKFVK